jgi:hypothetical protein
MNYDSFITSSHPEYKSPCRTVNCLSIVTGMSLFSELLPSNDSFVAIRYSGSAISESLLSNGLFRDNIILMNLFSVYLNSVL